MSLLLNAVKEADGRHSRPAAAPAAASTSGTARTAFAAEAQALSILEAAAPAAPAATPRMQECSRAAPAPAGEDRLARRRERRAIGTKGQGKNRQLLVLGLVLLVGGLGAAWLLLPGV